MFPFRFYFLVQAIGIAAWWLLLVAYLRSVKAYNQVMNLNECERR